MAHDHDLNAPLPRRLKMRELRVLIAVADHGSFHHAARVLHVSQPAVTTTIANLENLLGARLFDRTPQGATPTIHGASFIRRARAIFGELRQAAEELTAISGGTQGTLRVGSVTLPASSILPAALTSLLERSPGISVSTVEAPASVLTEALKTREIDLYLSRLPTHAIDPALRFDALYEDWLCVIAAKSHRMAAKKRVRFEELRGERWVLPPRGSAYRAHIDRLVDRCGWELPPGAVETLSILMMHGLIGNGGFVGFSTWSECVFSPVRPLVSVLKVDLPKVTAPIGVVTLKDRQFHPLGMQLVACIQELADGARESL